LTCPSPLPLHDALPISSFIRGLRKKAVMNLAEPSGSSPPEKPPGMAIICAPRIADAIRSMLSSISAGERLRTTETIGSAPASLRSEEHTSELQSRFDLV